MEQIGQRLLNRGARNDRRIVEDLHRPGQQNFGVVGLAAVRGDQIVQVDRERRLVSVAARAGGGQIRVAQRRIDACVIEEQVDLCGCSNPVAMRSGAML